MNACIIMFATVRGNELELPCGNSIRRQDSTYTRRIIKGTGHWCQGRQNSLIMCWVTCHGKKNCLYLNIPNCLLPDSDEIKMDNYFIKEKAGNIQNVTTVFHLTSKYFFLAGYSSRQDWIILSSPGDVTHKEETVSWSRNKICQLFSSAICFI